MKTPLRHCLRAALFALPLLFFFGLPAIALWLGGEWMQTDELGARQSAEPGRLVLYGPAFSNRIIRQKVRLIQQRRPQVLALGTSRVLQLRSGFFLPTVRFYNGGSCIQRVVNFRHLLASLPVSQPPEVLILGMDQYWFNPKSGYSETASKGAAWFEEQRTHELDRLEILRHHWWDVDRDLWSGALDGRKLLSRDARQDRIGFTALVWDQGTRSDGSYKYRAHYSNLDDPRHFDRNFQESFRKIDHGLLPYEYGRELQPTAVREVGDLLLECVRRGIMVVGFLPPFPHAVLARMQAQENRYDYVSKVEPALRPLFEQHGYELYNFTDAGLLNAPDREAIDGFHGSERTYLRVLIAMLRAGSFLNGYADLPKMEEALESTTRNTDLVPERF